jgi:hypothetical protein
MTINFETLLFLEGLSEKASESTLQAAENELGFKLPLVYRNLLLFRNGFLLPNGLGFYSTEDLAERNETYEIKEYCEQFVLIGDNSGGSGILIDHREDDPPVFASGFGDLDRNGFVLIVARLSEFIENLPDENYLRAKGIVP